MYLGVKAAEAVKEMVSAEVGRSEALQEAGAALAAAVVAAAISAMEIQAGMAVRKVGAVVRVASEASQEGAAQVEVAMVMVASEVERAEEMVVEYREAWVED